MSGLPDELWSDALTAFDALVELDAGARQARLEEIGRADPVLRRAVERLLEADAGAEATLARIEDVRPSFATSGDRLGLTGRTVGRFRVIAPLAEGGMGVVYRAEDLRLGRVIALKFPHVDRALDDAARARFLREARLAAGLDHPNLCPVLEAGETDEGHPFYAMPLYAGETLRARLEREGRLAIDTALDLAIQVSDGLAAAHRAGIVHRDLKPSNVMCLPDETVKILDFGLAKGSDLTVTAPWDRLGTIAYMAPEQVRGAEVTPRTDLWALGAMLYETLAGRRPFAGGNEIGVAHAILTDDAPALASVRPEVPASLATLVHRLLDRDPDQRPGSSGDVATALRRIRGGATGGLAIAAGRERAAGMAAPPRRRLAIAAATVLLGAAAVAGARMALDRGTATPVPFTLAVLPFDSSGIGALPVALSGEIADAMRRLPAATVPSWVTTAPYADSAASAGAIAARLGVGAAMRGTVTRDADRITLVAELVDSTGRLLWRETYDRSPAELPALPDEVAVEAARALGRRVAAAERDGLGGSDSVDAAAYELYLRGRAIELAGRPRDLWQPFPAGAVREAASFYARARDRDPGFARARAALARMHALAATSYDTTTARREEARVEADAALSLAPKTAAAHQATAAYWSASGDLPRAIEAYSLAIAVAPNDPDLHLERARLYLAQSRHREAFADLDAAARLDPGSPRAAFLAAVTYSRLRRPDEAMQAFNRAIAAAPGYHLAKVIKGHAYLRWTGDPDTLAEAMRQVPDDWDADGMGTFARFTAFWAQREHRRALEMLSRPGPEVSQDLNTYYPRSLMRARVQQSLGDAAAARASFAEARRFLEARLAERRGDSRIRVALGLALAGMGQTGDALRHTREAMRPGPAGPDAPRMATMGVAAEVYAAAGDREAALETLELLFTMPAGREVTVPYLRAWPGFDPLRDDPRFDALLARFGESGQATEDSLATLRSR